MSKRVRVVLNKTGVRQLLQSKEMRGVVEGRAAEAVNRLGDGYEMSSMTGHDRAHAFVRAVSYEAMEECLEDNTILKVLR
ncbi:MAG: hypothetical protein ACI3U8_02135 [Candidatus Onthomonas sp.]